MDQFKRTQKVDVIIVGAGLAGLTTAMKLLEKESTLQIKILEATSAAGGQLCETFLGEIGAKWITIEQYHISQLVQQLEVPTTRRHMLGPQLKRCWDLDNGFWSRLAKYELKRYMNAVELHLRDYQANELRKIRTMNVKLARATGTAATSLRLLTMQAHINANLFFRQSRQFMASLVQLVSGTAPQHIGYEEFMIICSSHGGLQRLIHMYIECPNNLLEINSNKLVHALLDRLKTTELLLWRRVLEVHQHRDYVEVRDSAFELHMADALVLAVPWESVHNMILTPKPPFALHHDGAPPSPRSTAESMATQRHRQRMIVTCMLLRYREAHWRNAGYSGSYMCNSLPAMPLLLGYEYRPGIYAAQIMSQDGSAIWLQPLAIQLLAKRYGRGMLLPTEYSERTFAVPSLVHVPPLIFPWHRVVFAHSATSATTCRGSLSGAVQSGQRAAVNVLLMLRPQNLKWQDIAEIQGDIRGEHTPPPIGWLKLWLSSLNLYNVGSFSLLAFAIVVATRLAQRRNALNS